MGGCVASRPLPQEDEVADLKAGSISNRVNGHGASKGAKTSSFKSNNKIIASADDEELACCGGGGVSAEDREIAETIPFFVEAERLASLRSLNIIEQGPEARFDSITSIMKAVFQVPISAITLVESETIHFHSRAGEWAKTAPRYGSFCERILEGSAPRMLVVEDTLTDSRFCKNRYVIGKPNIRFYAGAPLVGTTGTRYGTLCLIDWKTRQFTAEQYLMLCHFAELATRELERDKMMKEDQSELKNALRGAKSATDQVLRAIDALNEAVMLTDVSQPDWPVVYCNESWAKATGSDPEIARASSSSSSFTGSNSANNNNGDDDLTGPPLQSLVPFWHMFKGKAVDPSAVATAMAAARLGKAFTLSVRSTVRRGEVINLRFKPVSEPGRLGAAAMPQIAVPAGIGLDWMLQTPGSGGQGEPAAAPRLGRAYEPISADLTKSKRAQLAAALSVLSGNPLAEPQNNSIEKTAAAATAAASTVEQQDNDMFNNTSGSLLPEPVYYLGVVLNQGPPPPPPRHFPVFPFSTCTETEIVVPGIDHEDEVQVNGSRTTSSTFTNNKNNTAMADKPVFNHSGSFNDDELQQLHHLPPRSAAPLSSSSTRSEPTQQELQAAAELACSVPAAWDSARSDEIPMAKSEATTNTKKSATAATSADQQHQKTPIQALLGTSRSSIEIQSSSGAWGLIDRPPPFLTDATLGALVGCGSHSRCYRGVWKQERVAVKVCDIWRESYNATASIFTLPLDELPHHPNLVSVLASAVVTSPTGIPNRTHLEVWTVEEFCNRGQLGDAIECGKIYGAAQKPPPWVSNGESAGSSSRAVSATNDLRAVLLTAHDVASAMAVLHASGTIHGALTSNNVLMTSDATDKYRGWKALVGDYALVAAEAAISGVKKGVTNSPSSLVSTTAYGNGYYNGKYPIGSDDSGNEDDNANKIHPLSRFRGTTITAMNRPPCAAHIPPDVLLGAPLTYSSDIYSFGVLLWEMASARRAWRTLRPVEIVQAVALQGCRLPTDLKGVPQPVSELIKQCLSEDSTLRPSFVEVAETLRQLQNTLV